MIPSGHSAFNDPSAVANDASEAPRKVRGLADLHRMTALLLAERAPEQVRSLLVGAGGALELVALASSRPGWRFTGVDPSPAMLERARSAAASFPARGHLVEGTLAQAPAGPFDGATCLLVLHLLARHERLRTLRGIRRRLRSGARLVVAHPSPPKERVAEWMAGSVAFAAGTPADRTGAEAAVRRMAGRLALLTPDEDECPLRGSGFVDVEPFDAALSFRGRVASARYRMRSG